MEQDGSDREGARDRRVLLRRLGWTVLAVGVAATAVLVSPLVVPFPPPTPVTPPPSSTTPPSVVTTPVLVMPPVVTLSAAASPGTPPAAEPPPRAPVTSSPPPAFQSITVHAADPANLRTGARVIECASCRGGSRVGYIGGPNLLAVRVAAVPTAGTRTLTIVYETEEPRTLKVAVNDGTTQTRQLAGAASLLIPATTTLEVFVPAGDSWIRFFNDTGSAPDINEIVLS
ncbi:hypothetical protein [Actinophytocola oryzae]|uniref:CBM6 domain-containing protein n=1 Tax=Actinophytocola oryzae TaxID=502181 RepID=A0A4R7UPG7_9PSEU|nr:hypothetical protein [Actinophytocola oryzae]TDV35447.1 hypothetical protein CLV71_13434 [Actinophytocola oryzae]